MMLRVNAAAVAVVHSIVFAGYVFACNIVQAGEYAPGTTVSNTPTNQSGPEQPIFQHELRPKQFIEPEHSAKYLEDIEAHVEKHVGKVKTVLHEEVSDLVHIDVLLIPATAKRPYQLLVTSGVSDLAMHMPEAGFEDHNRVELMIALPKDWPISAAAFENENHYWPVRWLKKIGRLPHQNKTWIGWGHTIPNGNPVQTIADTQFTGVVLMPSVLLPDDFYKLRTKDGNTIRFYGLVPLYQAEMDLKLNTSLEALEVKLDQHDVDILLDKQRANMVSER